MTWLYSTIWVGLTLFVVGEYGKRRLFRGQPSTAFWTASGIGLAFVLAHFFLALAINDDWDHHIAWQVTETRMRQMFGFGWGGALVGNYLFVTVWAIDLVAWRLRPQSYSRLPRLAHWSLRLFYLCIIIPAAVVFAAGPRRWMGVLVVLMLLWTWRGSLNPAP